MSFLFRTILSTDGCGLVRRQVFSRAARQSDEASRFEQIHIPRVLVPRTRWHIDQALAGILIEVT